MGDTNLHKTKGKVSADPNKWVNDHGDYLYNFAWSRVQSKEIAEDLVQETFISALKSLKSFRGDSSELTWLTAILKRKVIDHYRKASTRKETSASQFAKPFEKEGALEGHWIMERAPKDWSTHEENPLRQEEFQGVMEECLSYLPPKWHSVFILKVMEEISSNDVCKEIGCTPSNLWVMLHRARLQLRECIENKWLK